MRSVSVEEAVAMIPNGATIMVGGFMAVGTSERLVDELVRQHKSQLNVICNDAGAPGKGVGKLFDAALVSTLTAMAHPLLTDAGGRPISALPGACTFDSAMSFGLIRGGHVSISVLGALQVDAEGHLANWMIPGKMVPGMGGAMDLVTGAKRVIVSMQHAAKGKSKIVQKCTLPLTSARSIDLVVTDLAVIGFPGGQITLLETAPGVSVAEVIAATEADLFIPNDVPEMKL